ncbi:MAG: hypothetical protein HQM10_13665 [Candidatus Riflebacteria bacterium]|nr:hypothetical protein [Candidatus Riflebacteria bacterium]
MQVNGVSQSGSSAELMQLLQKNQEAQLDMTKKMINFELGQKVSQNQAEGKGQILDVTG